MSVRKFFDDVQMATESGGRQHDKSGKPLVGRYRDGSTPAPGKRAYGAGQMQIGTARNTAKAHGIPWDENKFMNDREYNLGLADKHMEDLTKKYGDRTLARAAYHSGEPNVDRAIAKYGRQGFAQGLGPEGRNYIKMGTGGTGYSARQSGIGIADPRKFLDGLESTLAPESAASQNVSSVADKIFASDDELAARGYSVEQQVQNQGQAIDVLSQATDALHQVQSASMEQRVAETREVKTVIQDGVKALTQQVAPIVEARGRIADQLDKVNSMNPLERGIRGIFDLNYDQKYLETQMAHYQTTMDARAHDFEYLNNLHERALKDIDDRYALDTAIPGLAAKQAEEDLGIVGLRIQQTSGMLNSLKDMVSTQSQIISAKAAAREDMISRLDMPTIGKLMIQAEANGGEVQHGGVTLSYHELHERQNANEQQELNKEAVRMSIASNRMDWAEKYAANIVRSGTRQQVEGWIANGGMTEDGIKLDEGQLTQALQNHLSRGQMMAETAARTMPAAMALKTASEALNSQVAIINRTRSMYSQDDDSQVATIMAGSTSSIRQLQAAVRDNQPPEVIAALTAKVAQGQQMMTQYMDGVILRKVGGDKRAAGYMKSFVYGTPLDSGTATEAIAYFAAKGNMPEGLAVSPEARQVFTFAQKELSKLRDERENGKPLSQDKINQRLATAISGEASRTIGAARFALVEQSLPDLARRAGHDFGKLQAPQWQRAINASRVAAATEVAGAIGTDTDKVLQMYKSGKPLDSTPASIDLYNKFKSQQARFNSIEQSNLGIELDDLPAVKPGRANSEVMLEFLQSPKLSEMTKMYTQSRNSSSMGDYLIGPMAVGALSTNVSQYAEMMGEAVAKTQTTRKTLARTQPAGLLMNPTARSMVILDSIPGVGREGSKALAPIINKITQGLKPLQGARGTGGITEAMKAQDSLIYNQLRSIKLEDPRQEAYRKAAVSKWEQHQTQTTSTMQSIMSTVGHFVEEGIGEAAYNMDPRNLGGAIAKTFGLGN